MKRFSHPAALAAAALTAALYALAMPPWGAWPLAAVCLAPMLRALHGRGTASRAGLGLLCGTLTAFATILSPLSSALAAYFEAPPLAAGAAALLVAVVFGGGGFAVWCVLTGDPTRQGSAERIVRCALALVASELYRSEVLTGLPWLLLGHAFAPVPGLAQLASFGGTASVSAVLAATNAALLECSQPGRRRHGMAALGALALCLAAPALTQPAIGSVRPASGVAPGKASLRIVLVQPAWPREWRRDARRAADARERLETQSAAAGAADLLVWPENAFHVLMPANLGLVRRTLAALPEAPDALLFGAPRVDPGAVGAARNAALLVDAGGHVTDHHDKQHLVPFTEYAPLGLEAFDMGGAELTPGEELRPLALGPHRIGVLICYEALFPELAARLTRSGASLLFNLSNDGWFGGSSGAEQHLSAVVFRAIENRRPVLRATLDGITVAIDAGGRIVARLADGAPGTLAVDVVPQQRVAPATHIGRALAVAATLVALALAWARRRA